MDFVQHIRGPLLALAILPNASPAASATTVEFETSSHTAVLKVEVGAYAGTLQLAPKSGDAEPKSRTLPAPLRHVDDVRMAHAKLLVVGRTNRFNDMLVIYDLATLELLDVILCRELILSPSSRFAVFERFFPRDAPERNIQHLTLLYDVSATPQQNRLAGVPVPSFENRPWSIDAGYPIYPEPPFEKPRQYVLPTSPVEEEKNRDSVPPYAWSPDETRVAFIVHRRTDSSREMKLVVVEVGNDGRPVSSETMDVVPDFSKPFIELGFVDGSIRLARSGDHGKLIHLISRD